MNDSPERPERSFEQTFVDALVRLSNSEDRGSLARLRRTLANPDGDFSAYTVVGHLLPSNASQRWLDQCVFVAALYALHPDHSGDGRTLGTTLRRLRHELGENGEKSLDLLVGGLLNADEEDLPTRLRQVVTRLSQKGIELDYTRLLRDLRRWSQPGSRVQKNWARDYWTRSDEQDDDNGTVPNTEAAGLAEQS